MMTAASFFNEKKIPPLFQLSLQLSLSLKHTHSLSLATLSHTLSGFNPPFIRPGLSEQNPIILLDAKIVSVHDSEFYSDPILLFCFLVFFCKTYKIKRIIRSRMSCSESA